MRTRLIRLLALGVVAALMALPTGPDATAAGPGVTPGPPKQLHTTVVPGRQAIEVTWSAPTGLPTPLLYDVMLDGVVVATVPLTTTSYTITSGLELGHTYDVAVRGTIGIATGKAASTEQTLYIAPVTTVQDANPSNPLAGREWGVYLGLQDPAYNGWAKLGQAAQDELAPIAMIHKAKFFGKWVADSQADDLTRQYIDNAQDGDPTRLTIMTLFRMFPWEGEARIDKRLPTEAEQASYKTFVRGVARAIDDNPVAVVLQPDGYFVKKAFEAYADKLGRKQALLPARLLKWTSKTLSAQPHTTVYVDMGSEDWALGDAATVAKWLKLSGVEFARGFSMNVSHKNYLDREINFAKEVSQQLADLGLPGKHAVLDTSDNGQPFAGSEINPRGPHSGPYTAPGEINPCTKKNQKNPCTALGVPPTTDVDNPLWGLSAADEATAAKYVDAYLWVSRPWLPNQGTGGAKFDKGMATRLLKTWEFSPYFTGTP
ncbi:glycoside hydrolase family 6 protein [Nocardioides sp. CN2-186]|uniref:glycoside hydrolase family 6 protein n=1 Tax=Nocardioides tweenelious TaxID=3156607 RepID=UPI0032B56357